MKLVIFGLTISSSWGNGHATLWRGLCSALARRGWELVFCERDVPYYAAHRDLHHLPYGTLILYRDWEHALAQVRSHLADADAAIVTSYCPDGIAAGELICSAPLPRKIFYDLDTPVTLGDIARGRALPYIGAQGLRDFDLVLSYTGGAALTQLRTRLGAQRVAPLYGSVDPALHRPVAPVAQYRAALSYLGTYAADRQAALDALFITPARRRPDLRFVLGGAQYPANFPWTANIFFVRHLPPAEHAAFFSSARLTLNITRADMALLGYCPSGRLFEAAACGTPVLTDVWPGLDEFYRPGREVLVAHHADDSLAALELTDAELERIGAAARERTLAAYTAEQRAAELEELLVRLPPEAAPALATAPAEEA